jgi:preprotein translocase subunit SecA
MSDNKELIDELRYLVTRLKRKGKNVSADSVEKAIKALQDAEFRAEADKFQKSLRDKEINRLKALVDRLPNPKEVFALVRENSQLKAKLSEQVDPLQLLEYVLQKIPSIAYVGKDWMEDVIKQFKKERE